MLLYWNHMVGPFILTFRTSTHTSVLRKYKPHLSTVTLWVCKIRTTSVDLFLWNTCVWTAHSNPTVVYTCLHISCVSSWCDCLLLVVAVVHGDPRPCLQPLEEQWNQLLCERRTGLLWRHRLVCQHQWRECQQCSSGNYFYVIFICFFYYFSVIVYAPRV